MPNQSTFPSIEDRFWSKVDRSGDCWLWVAGQFRFGYGYFKYQGRGRRAHCVSWELAYGPIPEGMNVLHDCPAGDNPLCVNPAHLWVGTIAENNRDRDQKGRFRPPTGERNGFAKLTASDVRSIRFRYENERILQREIATEYGVSQVTISRIIRGENWNHLH